MLISKEKVLEKRNILVKDLDRCRNDIERAQVVIKRATQEISNLNYLVEATNGAIQVLDQLLETEKENDNEIVENSN